MSTAQDQQTIKARRTADLYNMVPNAVWSLVSLGPLAVFCYRELPFNVLFFFAVCSILPAFLPASLLGKMGIFNHAKTYEKLGVGIIRKVSQQGKWVNRLIRKKHPGYKTLQRNKRSIQKLLGRTLFYEKFHLMLLLFFLLASIYAVSKGFTVWTISLFLLNTVYNVYPILLQQYIRLKLARYRPARETRIQSPGNNCSGYPFTCMSVKKPARS